MINALHRERQEPVTIQAPLLPRVLPAAQTMLKRVGYVPMYACDQITRRSLPLQATDEAKRECVVQISTKLAEEMHVKEGDILLVQQSGGIDTTLALRINPSLAHRSVLLPVGIRETAGLGEAFGPISLSRV